VKKPVLLSLVPGVMLLTTNAFAAQYCQYAVSVGGMDKDCVSELRRADKVCILCSGQSHVCSKRDNERVKVGYKGHECHITLGGLLEESCHPCPEGQPRLIELK
jgi:hypothetical protein